jgi:4-hydroxyphenylacetate 3-monooxygenase
MNRFAPAAPAADRPADLPYIVSKPVARDAAEPNLRTGAQFRCSLRDNRRVVIDGRDVADVTEEPTLRRGIDTLARYYDAQHAPATRDLLTCIDPDTGERISTAWLVPRSIEDLWRYDRLIKASTALTFGNFGRPVDYGSVKAISFVAWDHLIRPDEPDAHGKIMNFLRTGARHNLLSADVIIDVQVDRKMPMAERASRLRVVEERKDGIVVSGAKAGNSVMAQGNIGTISMPPPVPGMPEECMFWGAIPANAPGLTLVLREATTNGAELREDHPLDADGEEADGILLFDRVFIPWEYVFSYRNPKISTIYNTLGQFAFWKICTRLSYRADLFVGAAQLIVDALGTDHIPAVRALVSEVIHYAATLRGLMTAAIERATPTESGVMLPDHLYVTAGRLHSIEAYPRIVQILRELSGQGLIGRVPQKSWDRPDLGPLLDAYLPGHKMTARDKNRLFNIVWDMSCSPSAMRLALFENINATPAPVLREELYRIYDRSNAIEAIKTRAGIA